MTKEQQTSLKVVKAYVMQPNTLYNVYELNGLVWADTIRGKDFGSIIIEQNGDIEYTLYDDSVFGGRFIKRDYFYYDEI